MDKRSMAGLFLILILFVVWQQVVAPSPEELEAQQRAQDSLALVEQMAEAKVDEVEAKKIAVDVAELSDSARVAEFGGNYGDFATAIGGSGQDVVIENDLMKVTFTTKGGRVKQVELKEYLKVVELEDKTELKTPLYLLEDEKNRFEYLLPVSGAKDGVVRTGDLEFTPQIDGKTVVFRAAAANGGYFEQRYSLEDGTYLMDYDLRLENLQDVLTSGKESIQLEWDNYLDKIEKNATYEGNLTTTYYKPVDDDAEHCSCTGDDTEEINDQRLKWVANSQQFFTSGLFADDAFDKAVLNTVITGGDSEQLKFLSSTLSIPVGRSASENVGMSFYVGPNEFDRMQNIGYDFSDVIPFGRSIFGAINRWLIRPVFNFLNSTVGNAGISILLLTFLVKLLVYPLTYKMLVSNTKMQVLKPEIEKLKNKHKDDKQALQMETMKMYQEYGASPLGGCLPMVLQMPIWFALYRFFPASIDFRQENFLWASDLSTYDTWINLPFTVPLGFGSHISLFAVLWAVTTLIYAYFNSRHQDFTAQPAMKYMQYLMPVMFLGFFNSFAAGLTCYLFFSNLFNIVQTIVTKEVIIDKDKLLVKLQKNKAKPKKSGGFTSRLQDALAEQQRQQAKKDKK